MGQLETNVGVNANAVSGPSSPFENKGENSNKEPPLHPTEEKLAPLDTVSPKVIKPRNSGHHRKSISRKRSSSKVGFNDLFDGGLTFQSSSSSTSSSCSTSTSSSSDPSPPYPRSQTSLVRKSEAREVVDRAFKILLVGPRGAGRTSLLGRFATNVFLNSLSNNVDEYSPIICVNGHKVPHFTTATLSPLDASTLMSV